MIRNDENLKDSTLPLLIHPQAEARGQVQLCQNLIINLFEKGDSPCTKKFPDVKTKNKFLVHYLKDIFRLTSQNGVYTTEINHQTSFYRIHKTYATKSKLTKSKFNIHK